MDYFHNFLKFISYERYKVISILLIVFMIFSVSCQQTAIAPTTNKAGNRDSIVTNVDNKISSLNDDLKYLDTDFNTKLEELSNKYKSELAKLTASTSEQKDKIIATQKQLVAQAELSIKEIERKESIIETGLKFVQDTFPQLPYLSTVVGLGGVIFAGGAVADKKRANDRLAELKSSINGTKT